MSKPTTDVNTRQAAREWAEFLYAEYMSYKQNKSGKMKKVVKPTYHENSD